MFIKVHRDLGYVMHFRGKSFSMKFSYQQLTFKKGDFLKHQSNSVRSIKCSIASIYLNIVNKGQ